MTENAFADDRNSLEAVVRILLLTVHADGRKRQVEMDQLYRTMSALHIFSSGDMEQPEEAIARIVDVQSSEIEELAEVPVSSTTVDQTIDNIDDPDLIPQVIEAMYAIAYSDKEYHFHENQLLSRAAEIWKINISKTLEPGRNMFPQ